MPGQNNNDYYDEWRKRVDTELERTAYAQQQTSIIQERILAHLDEHDRRLEEIEKSPDEQRSTLSAYGGCLGQIVFAAISSIGLLISVSALIIALTR